MNFNKITANLDVATRCDILEAITYLKSNVLTSEQLKEYLNNFEINHNRSARVALEQAYKSHMLSILKKYE